MILLQAKKRISFWKSGKRSSIRERNVLLGVKNAPVSKNAICFHTRKSQNLFEIKTFPSLSKTKTLKKGKRWHALCQCYTQLSGRTSDIHTGHSVSVQWLWLTLCTMKRVECFQCWILWVCVCVWESAYVHELMCVCVDATDKGWNLPEINCLMTLLNIRQHRHFKHFKWNAARWYIGHVLWCLQQSASLSLIKYIMAL